MLINPANVEPTLGKPCVLAKRRALRHKVSEAWDKGTAVVWGEHLRDERRHG